MIRFSGASGAHFGRSVATEGPIIHQLEIVNETLIDNDEFEFTFDPIPDSKNQVYLLTMEAPDTPKCNGVTPWMRRLPESNANSSCIGINDEFLEGHELRQRLVYSPSTPVTEVPEGILLSPVSACNLNCIHCISRDTRRSLNVLSDRIRREIAGHAEAGQIKHIASDYSGDLFFSDKKYGWILDYLIGLNVDLWLDTHGNFMSTEIAERLIESKLKRINFSLDAATHETHASIRRGSRPFIEVMANIIHFVSVRSRYKARGNAVPVVTVAMTLMRRNLHELPMLIDWASELGADAVVARHLEAYTEDLEVESLFFDQDRCNETVAMARAQAKRLGLHLVAPNPFPVAKGRAGHRYCPIPWHSAVVLGNGDVMACCVPTTKMGSLNNQSLTEIWNGKLYSELRRRVNSDDPPLVCKNCPIYRYENNPNSYLFSRIRPTLKPLHEELLEGMAKREATTSCLMAAAT